MLQSRGRKKPLDFTLKFVVSLYRQWQLLCWSSSVNQIQWPSFDFFAVAVGCFLKGCLWFHITLVLPRMAPARKKQRGQTSIADAFNESSMAASMSAVGPFQKDVALCIELMYSIRHGTNTAKRPFDDAMGNAEMSSASGVPKPDDKGIYPFPLDDGGTFMDIVQRACSRKDWVLQESAEMLWAAGLIEANDPCKVQEEFASIAVSWTVFTRMLN